MLSTLNARVRAPYITAIDAIVCVLLLVTVGQCQSEPTPANAGSKHLQPPRMLLPLLHAQETQKELKLTSEQIEELENLFASTDGPWWRARNLPADKQDEVVVSQEAWLSERLQKVLEPSQWKRLGELEMQAQSGRVLLRPDIQERLGLQQEQRLGIRQTIADSETTRLQLSKQAEKKPSLQRELGQLQQRENTSLLSLLNPTQQQSLLSWYGPAMNLQAMKRIYAMAPQLEGIDTWIQGEPIDLKQQRGKVIALHFYAFQCSNCVANLPVYNRLYEEFKSEEFLMVGIQTPELAPERDAGKVKQAAKKAEMQYPVALDVDSATWKAWDNTMWPTLYLIDKHGYIRWWWQGELNWQGATGDEDARKAIRELLSEP